MEDDTKRSLIINYGLGLLMVALAAYLDYRHAGPWWIAVTALAGIVLILHGHFPKALGVRRIALGASVLGAAGLLILTGLIIGEHQRRPTESKSSIPVQEPQPGLRKPQPPAPSQAEPKNEQATAKHTPARKQEAKQPIVPNVDQPEAPSPVPTQIVNAPGGIGNIGGTVVNPTVNNFAPPPAILSSTTERLIGEVPGKGVTKVRLTTDREIAAAIIEVVFSGPFDVSKEWFDKHGAHLEGSGVQQIDIKVPIFHDGQPVPNSIGLIINLPAAFLPSQTLSFAVQSTEDIHVLQAVTEGSGR